MCNCKGKCSCSSVITTGRGPTGPQGPQGIPGTNGADGVLNWSLYNLDCWVDSGIIDNSDTQDEITQALIDTVCETFNAVNVTPKAINDYRTIDQDTTLYIDVINNDRYYPSVVVTITSPPSNGTATVEPDGITIKYIPNSGFFGVEDFGYTITDPLSVTSSAIITITVKQVLSEQAIENIIINQITTILQSNEYWDLGFNIGDKIGISAINLIDFDFSNSFTAGKGKITGRYKKWAICNGNNGTEDLSSSTLRGFNHLDTDYDMGVTGKSGGSDSVSITLTKANIPAHVHNYTENEFYDAGGSNGDVENAPSIGDWKNRVNTANTENGTADGLKTSPDAIIKDIRNAYKTAIFIQKIS